MRVDRAVIRIVDIPMRHSVHHSLAERHSARNIIVELTADDGTSGWGECCPRPYVTGETVDGVLEFLGTSLIPMSFREIPDDLQSARDFVLALLDELPRERHAAFCAVELAALDLLGRVTGRSAGEVLGSVCTDPVIYSGVVAGKTDEAVSEQIQLNRALGVKHVKIKVGESLERNIEIVGLVRRELGEDVSLRLDANCAWTGPEGVRQLRALASYRIDGVEQPTPSDDLEGLLTITRSAAVPVVVDESLCSTEDAKALIDTGACEIFNIRISKCGGLSNAARLYSMAANAGLRCQLGAQVGETGILSAAGRHFASRLQNVLWCEGSFGKLLLEEEIMQPDISVGAGGVGHALTLPGIGVEPKKALLDHYTTHRQVVFTTEGGTKS